MLGISPDPPSSMYQQPMSTVSPSASSSLMQAWVTCQLLETVMGLMGKRTKLIPILLQSQAIVRATLVASAGVVEEVIPSGYCITLVVRPTQEDQLPPCTEALLEMVAWAGAGASSATAAASRDRVIFVTEY